jgi:hypothetical protein
MELNKQQLRSVADDALHAFWEVVVRHFPTAETGDLCPWLTIQLQIAAENAIEEWVDNNVPATKGDNA